MFTSLRFCFQSFEVYSIHSSKMSGDSLGVSNFNRFTCNEPPVLPKQWFSGFGRSSPYARSLLDASTLASKERVYGLVCPGRFGAGCVCDGHVSQINGHFTHEPRAVIMKFWGFKRKCPKGCPKTPFKSCSVVMDPQVYCEVMSDRALNQMLFQWIFVHADPHTW